MRIKFLALAATLAGLTMASCDDTTDTLGESLTDNLDKLKITTDTFQVSSRSIMADSVLSRSTTGYLGTIRDPETGNYITGDFMAQFNTLENYQYPERDSIASLDEHGEVVADSCHIRLFFDSYYGDSLSTMRLTAYEMERPMEETERFYSNFDPMAEGYVRENGLKISKTYTLLDLSVADSIREDESLYSPNIKLTLNKPYTDRNGVTYNNYGTYVMRKYYENPANFKNSYHFIREVCPGFYFKMDDGVGSMANISVCQLNVYFKYNNDSTYTGVSSFSGTEEVLQTTNISNDKGTLRQLAADETCTYLKTPSGIFTELTLPVDDILRGHETDTINAASVSLQRLNDRTSGPYTLQPPTTLLMIPADSLTSFFEQEEIVDYKRSFLATYSSTSGNYTFSNISGLISHMDACRRQGLATDPQWEANNPNWNRAVVVPVTVTTSTTGAVVKVMHDMSLRSVRLVGGSQNAHKPLSISVVYSKYNHE